MTFLLDPRLEIDQVIELDGSSDRIVRLEPFPRGLLPWAGYPSRNICRITAENMIVWRVEPLGTPQVPLTVSSSNYFLDMEFIKGSLLVFRVEGDVYNLDTSSGIATFVRWNMR